MSATDRPVHRSDPSEHSVVVSDEHLTVGAFVGLIESWADDDVVVLIGEHDRLPTIGLSSTCDAALDVDLVTDAVKVVDAEGLIVETFERSELRYPRLPMLLRVGWLRRSLDGRASSELIDLLAAVLASDARIEMLAMEPDSPR